jgi:uncharacterized protein YjbJ (UPF0337 family)
MNKNQMKGASKNTLGKVQRAAGKLTGNRSQQAKGLGKQVAGKVQQRVGDAESALEGASRKSGRRSSTKNTLTRSR